MRGGRGVNFVVAAAIALSGCAKRSAVRVELDVFSGLPNPTWELALPDVTDIVAKIGSLPRADVRVAVPDLGYRGFLLSTSDDEIRVFRGYLIRNERGQTRTYRDTENIEERLATDARARGYGDVVRTSRFSQ